MTGRASLRAPILQPSRRARIEARRRHSRGSCHEQESHGRRGWQRGGDSGPAHRGPRARGRRSDRHHRGHAAGQGPGHEAGDPGRGLRLARDRHQRLRRDRRLGGGRDHRRHRAQAGHEPGRPAQHQLQDRQGVHRERGQSTRRTRSWSWSRTRSTRCAQVAYKVSGFPKQPRVRHGGRARLGPHAHVHRHGAGRLGRERQRLRARRPRRHHGPAAALLDRRRQCRSPSCCLPTASRRS